MLKNKIKILLYGTVIWSLGEGMLGPLFAVFTKKIGGDILDIAWAWALYLIVTGALVMIVGKMSDTWRNKERLMIIGFSLNTILTFCYIFVSAPMHLFIIEIGLGIGNALFEPTWDALFDRADEDEKKEGFLWGLMLGEKEIILGIAVIIGGIIVSYFSFNVLFITMGIIQLIATIYQAQIFKIKQA